MIHVILDTQVLKTFVNHLYTDWNLDLFHYWYQEGQIQIITPYKVKDEWRNKHRGDKLQSANKAIKELLKKEKENKALGIEGDDPELDSHQKRIQVQVDKIDALINSSPEIKADSDVLVRIEELASIKAAPFFDGDREKPNDNDAKIIFHGLQFAKTNGIKEIILISGNNAEFCSKDNRAKIHPDIEKEYPGITIHYFERANDATKFLKDHGLSSPPGLPVRKELVKSTIYVDRKAHILDQLHMFFSKRFLEWQFLPGKFVFNQYPFILDQDRINHIPNSTLVTDNAELFELLVAIKVDNEQYFTEFNVAPVENVQEKITQIMSIFRRLNIYQIYLVNTQTPVALAFTSGKTACASYKCAGLHPDYNDFLINLENKPTEVHDLMNLGYSAYKLGEYISAIDIFYQAMNIAQQQGKSVFAFICQFNLKILHELEEKSRYGKTFGDQEQGPPPFDIMETIKVIGKDSTEIAMWIYEESFMKEVRLQMMEAASRQGSMLRSRHSFQEKSIKTIHELFFNTWSFLTANCIVYDTLQPFDQLFISYLEGIFPTLEAVRMTEGKPIALNDQVLNLITSYGNQRLLKDFWRHHRMTEIPYLQTSPIPFYQRVLQLLDQYLAYNPPTDQWPQNPGHDIFKDKLLRGISVGLLCCQYLILPLEQLDELAARLEKFIRDKKVKNKTHLITSINQFFRKVAPVIDKRTVADFMIMGLNNRDRVPPDDMSALARILQERNTKITYGAEGIENLFKLAQGSCDMGDMILLGQIIQCTKLSNDPAHFNAVKDIVSNQLKQTFREDIYYIANIYALLNGEQGFKEQYILAMNDYILSNGKPEKPSYSHIVGVDGKIDDYLNFVFKEGAELPEAIISALKQRGAYYRWLLDLEGFNYLEFDLEWLYYANTIYYSAHFKKSNILKTNLLNMIKTNPRSYLEIKIMELFL